MTNFPRLPDQISLILVRSPLTKSSHRENAKQDELNPYPQLSLVLSLEVANRQE